MKNKDKIIAVRVTEEDLYLIKLKAKKLGLSISSYLRMLALKES
jgi:predicted DNA binding CopG/RHH family protein